MPGMNSRQMKKMMKQMGIKQVDIPCEKVVISSNEKDIVITNPKVIKVKMQGQETFQITGTVSEQEKALEISQDDVKTVMEKANVDKETAQETLRNNEGDLAKSIIQLTDSKI
ncbi:MAG: Nascent polypeptide-associated complex protein [Candidatus Woesearchaeota archaeon]|nr:Nascent polypeptide-associated complex protein [Candidatus Woesearchaeota archaeon]